VLSTDFQEFYRNWIRKADEYQEYTLANCFDKFFTMYVVYNRLYAESTFFLARRKEISIENRKTFPDARAAKEYVLQFIGSANLVEHLECDHNTTEALNTITRLIEEARFHIKLDMISGNGQKEEDIKLLQSLKSDDRGIRAIAILDVIYSIRCNMFHGHKGFQAVQVDILRPVTVLLRKVIEIVYDKLQSAHIQNTG